MDIALLNASKGDCTNDQCKQLAEGLTAWFDMYPTTLLPVDTSLTFFADPSLVLEGMPIITIFQNPPQLGVGGEHIETAGLPLGSVFTRPLGAPAPQPLFAGKYCIAMDLSHELIELVMNPTTKLYMDGPCIPEGSQYAYEFADPVEDTFVNFSFDGIEMTATNFVLPAYWLADAPKDARFDALGLLKAPFSRTPGGYFIVRQPHGPITRVFGEEMPEWRRAAHRLNGRFSAKRR